jgi:antitoxin component HigA of HigAB toxin-antitoxin module
MMKSNQSFRDLFENAQKHEDYWTEGFVIEFTEELTRLMKERNVSRSVLAERIGRSPAYVTKVLRGNATLTIASMAMLAWALEAEVRICWADPPGHEYPGYKSSAG